MAKPEIEAAREYLRGLNAAKTRAALSRQVAASKGTPKESLRAFCRRKKLPLTSVHRHFQALQKTGLPAVSFRPNGRPRALTDAEDSALVAYIVELENAGVYASIPMVVAAANELRASRKPPEGPVGKGWYGRWIKDHGELKTSATQPVEASRLGFEAHADIVAGWFERAKQKALGQQVSSSEVWNADEVGVQIGCRDGRVKVVMVAKKKHEKPRVLDPNNRESCTLIGAGNAVGDSLAPFCIFKQWPLAEWVDSDLPGDTAFVRSESGFSNAEIMLAWIRHFNRLSWPLSARVQSQGSPSLKQWFGYDSDARFDFLMDPFEQDYDEDGQRKKGRHLIWRWLILDGFAGHLSMEIIDYCLRFDIQIVTLPAHSTHLMQPMDVGVFSHLKRKHQTVLAEAVQIGNTRFSRTDFVLALEVRFPKMLLPYIIW